jgi:Fe-S oxidoreductase
MDVSEKAIHDATLTLLRSIRCEVVVPGNQVCCGALHVHSGDRKTAHEFAIKNLSAFEPRNLHAIITNAAGCGAQLMEYHHLFAEVTSNAQMNCISFENKVIDILEFLSTYSELLEKLPFMDDDDTVLYDAPCHLMHAQKVDENPIKLLISLPGVALVPLTESNWCCGSRGIYNLVQPDLSKAVLERKIESCPPDFEIISGSQTIFTGNPVCLFQIPAGLRSSDI